MNIFKKYQFYSKEQIELKANEVLRVMEVENFPPKWPFEASRAADALGIMIDRQSIPPDTQGSIVAKILPLERKIVLNELIPNLNGGFEQSTIAHEIGHWILHVNQDEADGFTEQLELNLGLEDVTKYFLCRTVDAKISQINMNSQLGNIEWQAQFFASCLLMPIHILEATRKGRDLTNWKHLYAMKDQLGVTISNLINRLEDLDWINIPKGSKQIYLGKAAPNGQTNLFNR
ncbi:ImmA/IrrE family metallo-endopeptidase [Nostoc sp. LEGE 12450]|uniref:ImmA/IrrE family metallo-endopeptidase n=1 Tax=Nostoc sp. LEGE 12450 TaxID=1828643 RepID=UPI00187F9452|nr:ImmA/IrrE family metallo-endopeptidase [Nostoc sp. LEGE 12450]MBE8985914.1 ImmA/IrrE family metallo-endopeptidase [Nostoc sp. LEGE 12450]